MARLPGANLLEGRMGRPVGHQLCTTVGSNRTASIPLTNFRMINSYETML